MGNYYEGDIRVPLIPELPKDVLEALNCLNKGKSLPDEHKNIHPYFQKEKCYDPGFFFEYVEKYDDVCTDPFYVIRMRVNMKGYRNHVEDFLDFLKPYMKHDLPVWYLGRIVDEDGRYKKDFFMEEEYFESVIKQRRPLCGECDKLKYSGYVDGKPATKVHDHYLCDDYDLCKRAFDLGAKSVQKNKPAGENRDA